MNYKRIYDNLIQRARTRVPPEGYIERHHIIPRCLGGSDDESNLVALTPEEHYVAHQLLVKIHPNESGLIYAANSMTANHTGRKNKRYGWIKRKFSKQRKADSLGSGNSQHGTIWINKIDTTENKKIKKGEPIPEGWQKGRKLSSKVIVSTCSICSKKLYKRVSYCSEQCKEIGKNKSLERKRKKQFTKFECVKKSLLDNNLDIDNAMKTMGYKVPQYGSAKNYFKTVLGTIQK